MHISIQTFKEKIINILRLPIKYIDKKNIKSKKLTVIVNSNFSKKNIDKIYGISSIVVYPGIDISEFSNKKIQKKYQIISVGAINPLKGFDTIIKAIGHINKRIRPKLVLVGNGSADNYCNYLFKLAKVCKVDLKIKINISKSELKKEYASSKIFAYAPHNEPFGIVVQEAMASNLPIVVYGKGGGYTEIIDQKNGYIINDRSEKKWQVPLQNYSEILKK
jgi:glycosyltransferase involved in cell wall biosynthesis